MLARSLSTMARFGVGQVGVVAAARGHVPDVGVGRLAVHGLHVEGLLAVPARRVALVRPGQRVRAGLVLLELARSRTGWSPTTVANWLASVLMVGDA